MGAPLSPYDLDNTKVSTFSLANTVRIIITCKAKLKVIYLWANYFDIRCNVTHNRSIAEYKCLIKRPKEYICMGVKSENMCFNGVSANDNYSFGWSADDLKSGLLNKKTIMKLYKKYFPKPYS